MGSSSTRSERSLAHVGARERELLPLAEAHLRAAGPRGAELRVESRGESRDDVVGAGAFDRGGDRGLVVESRHVADAHAVARAELELEEILKRAGEARAPRVGGNARERRAVDENVARRRLVHLGEQLHERALAGAVLADDRDDGARGEIEGHVVEHERLRAGIRERHVIEANAARETRRAPARSAAAVNDAA